MIIHVYDLFSFKISCVPQVYNCQFCMLCVFNNDSYTCRIYNNYRLNVLYPSKIRLLIFIHKNMTFSELAMVFYHQE
jgi:hypothetical protein